MAKNLLLVAGFDLAAGATERDFLGPPARLGGLVFPAMQEK
jgi:hypothetical protein